MIVDIIFVSIASIIMVITFILAIMTTMIIIFILMTMITMVIIFILMTMITMVTISEHVRTVASRQFLLQDVNSHVHTLSSTIARDIFILKHNYQQLTY